MNTKIALKIILSVSIIGVLFSGVLSYKEFFEKQIVSCPTVGAPGTIWGYPACVYGFIMYAFIFFVAIWGLRKK